MYYAEVFCPPCAVVGAGGEHSPGNEEEEEEERRIWGGRGEEGNGGEQAPSTRLFIARSKLSNDKAADAFSTLTKIRKSLDKEMKDVRQNPMAARPMVDRSHKVEAWGVAVKHHKR